MKLGLLARLLYLNRINVLPTKYKLAAATNNSTRSLRYKAIDSLIEQGLIQNQSERTGNYSPYALFLTYTGHLEVRHWADFIEGTTKK